MKINGKKLKLALRRTDITQQAAADKLGVSRQTLNSWLKIEELNDDILQSVKKNLQIDLTVNYGHYSNNSVSNILNEPEPEYTTTPIKAITVPIYDIEFSAGVMAKLIDNKEDYFPVGYLGIPEVSGCDVIIRAKGDGMADRINDRDWIAIKKMNKDEWFPLGYIYAIETDQAQVIKYIKKGSTDKTVKIISHNKFYDEEEIALELIKELWSVRAILPFSKVETLM